MPATLHGSDPGIARCIGRRVFLAPTRRILWGRLRRSPAPILQRETRDTACYRKFPILSAPYRDVASGRSVSKNKEPAWQRGLFLWELPETGVALPAAACLRTAAALEVSRTLKPIVRDLVSSMVLLPAMAFAAWDCNVGKQAFDIRF